MNQPWTKRVIGIAGILLFLFVLATGSAPVAHAEASLTVNTLTDEDVSGDGTCSLREAIKAAELNANYHECSGVGYGEDEISFAVTGTLPLSSTLPTISDGNGLAIGGPPGGITLDGGGIYQIMIQTSDAPLTLQGLTFANGYSATGGGAIRASGGGSGLLTILASTFLNNSADTNGGAILNYTETIIADSTFQGNSASQGGALYIAPGWSVHSTNNTFAGNSASTSGGALYQASTANLYLQNTIIANSPSGGNCGGSGTIHNDTYSLQYPDQACGIGITVGDPKLGPLANNGGPTQTMALLTGSAAIGAGHNSACTAAIGSPNYGAGSYDQRGMLRPQPQEIGAYCDIGAYERGPATAISAAGGAAQSTQINSAFPTPLQAKVTDILGGGLDGVNVTVAGPSTGAGIASGGTVATNSNGIAAFSATANSTAGGPYTVTAATGAFTATFSLTNNPYATVTAIANHLPNPSRTGQPVTVTFTVTSPNGTPAGDVTVGDGAVNCTAAVAAGSCAITWTTPGTHMLTASYVGNTTFGSSTSTVVLHNVLSSLYLPLVIR